MNLRDELIAYFWGKDVHKDAGKLADTILECPAIKEIIESLEQLTILGDVVVEMLRENQRELWGVHNPSPIANSFEKVVKRGKAALEGGPSSPTIDTEKHSWRGNIPREPQTTIDEDLMEALLD